MSISGPYLFPKSAFPLTCIFYNDQQSEICRLVCEEPESLEMLGIPPLARMGFPIANVKVVRADGVTDYEV